MVSMATHSGFENGGMAVVSSWQKNETRDFMWMGSPIQNNCKFIVISIFTGKK